VAGALTCCALSLALAVLPGWLLWRAVRHRAWLGVPRRRRGWPSLAVVHVVNWSTYPDETEWEVYRAGRGNICW
jgi:hypothetical protein